MLMAAGVGALLLRLCPNLFDERGAGLDLDEIEDARHRRFKVVQEIGVADYAQVLLRNPSTGVRLVKRTQHFTGGLVEVLHPAPLVFLGGVIPGVVAVLQHTGHQRHSGRDDFDRVADDVDQLGVRVARQHLVEAEGQHAGLGQDASCVLVGQVASPALLVVTEEPLPVTVGHTLDAHFATAQITAPVVLPGKEIRPGERSVHSPEEPQDVIGLDAPKVGVVDV